MTEDPDMERARQALLTQIESMAGTAKNSMTVLRLAEAWAWLSDPSQPHGSGSAEGR